MASKCPCPCIQLFAAVGSYCCCWWCMSTSEIIVVLLASGLACTGHCIVCIRPHSCCPNVLIAFLQPTGVGCFKLKHTLGRGHFGAGSVTVACSCCRASSSSCLVTHAYDLRMSDVLALLPQCREPRWLLVLEDTAKGLVQQAQPIYIYMLAHIEAYCVGRCRDEPLLLRQFAARTTAVFPRRRACACRCLFLRCQRHAELCVCRVLVCAIRGMLLTAARLGLCVSHLASTFFGVIWCLFA